MENNQIKQKPLFEALTIDQKEKVRTFDLGLSKFRKDASSTEELINMYHSAEGLPLYIFQLLRDILEYNSIDETFKQTFNLPI